MEVIQNYVLTQDTASLFERLNNDEPLSKKFLAQCDKYFFAMQQVTQTAFPENQIVAYTQSEISTQLSRETRKKLESNSQTYCICLDRYLLSDIESDFPDRFFRFSITRKADGTKIPRVMQDSFEKQIELFRNKISNYDQKKALIVDDGIFSGGTVRDTMTKFAEYDTPLVVEGVLAFMGDSSLEEKKEILRPTENLFDWVDIRDFTPFGGKTITTSKSNRIASAVPYLFPWSDGASASLQTSPELFTTSKKLIREFGKLVSAFEQSEYGKPVRFRELVKSGFPLPTTNLGLPLSVSINDSVTAYLERCVQYIESEENRPVYVFDMDGTLYQLDGKDNGFSGSTLEKTVEQNALSFIKNQEGCSYDEAQNIYATGIKDSIGLSRYLANRYNITREEYFDKVWNIDPRSIIKNYETSVRSIQKLKENSNNKLILLTAAPSAWATQVINALGLSNVFERVFTGEQYGKKDEIFQRLAGWYKPENIISVGDQQATDIEPARKYGMQTLLVYSPNGLKQLISLS